MNKKSLIASLMLSTTLLATSISSGYQAYAMGDDGVSSNSVAEKQLQQQALHYNEAKVTKSTQKINAVRTTKSHTYSVKSGDTLSQIARTYRISYQELMKTNHLTTTDLSINQQLLIPTAQGSTPATSNTALYEVKKGDTLSSIATNYGTSYTNLMALNQLHSTVIYPNQKLKVSGSATASTVVKASAPTYQPSPKQQPTSRQSASLVTATKIALKQLDVPYVSAGTTPSSGFDCSGLIYYSLNQAGFSIDRKDAAGYYAAGSSVNTPRYGDLVFFSGTYKPGISHVGFYIGGGNMVSASGDYVQIDNIHNSYWSKHFTGFKRY